MTPSQQIIALALHDKLCTSNSFDEDNECVKCGKKRCSHDDVPDYLTSLDAIMPLVRKLDAGQRYVFGWTLAKILFGENCGTNDYLSDVDNLGYRFTDISTATVEQISEALLKTLGLWREE